MYTFNYDIKTFTEQTPNNSTNLQKVSMKSLFILCVTLFIFAGTSHAMPGVQAIKTWNEQTSEKYADVNIVEAIYKAEGGRKAKYLYGIRSVRYDTPEEARRICFNTVRNNRKRYKEYGHKKYNTYLEFLASRYCPVGADNDPRGLNKHWLKNVKYFLKKNK